MVAEATCTKSIFPALQAARVRMGRFFYYGPIIHSQENAAAGGCCDHVGVGTDASSVQSPVQMRVFMALDNGCGALQRPQCFPAALSLVQSRCSGLLPALCRFHCWTVPRRSFGISIHWTTGPGCLGHGCGDVACWIPYGSCHSSACQLSALDSLVTAKPDKAKSQTGSSSIPGQDQ
jgi:hypothetical protein